MNSRWLLIFSTTAIVVIWQLPYGRQILYPLTLLATYAHELGHGLGALLLGENFDRLVLNADGSGMALWSGHPGRLKTALIASAGLLGPTVAGISMLLVSSSPRYARRVLALLCVLVLVSIGLWLRNAFGVFFLLATASIFGLGARFLPDAGASFLLHLIAVTLCLSWFNDLGYMFSGYAIVNGVSHASDSAVIAQALWLPFWFWGGLIALFSLGLTAFGIWFVSRR
jgi:hypothetical protein